MFIHPPDPPTSLPPIAGGSGVRAHNVGLLLRMVWSSDGGASRSDLARRSGLSRSTVSTIVAELIGSGLVEESHAVRRGNGRPPILLRFNDARRLIGGVEMGKSHVCTVLMDLRGRVCGTRRVDAPVQVDPIGTLRQVVADVRALCAERGVEPSQLLGLGVGVPCPLDDAAPGRLSTRILPAWDGHDVARTLHDALGVRVFLENDANLGALAEAWWGAGRGVHSLVFIKVATGVGAGVVVNGEVFRGSTGIAGEIGHTTVDPGGRRCRCGLRGCLEAEIGSEAVIERVRSRLATGETSALSTVASPTLADVVAAVRRRDPLAVTIIEDIGRHLGIAVANLLNVLNPACVVLGGRLTDAGEPLLRPLRTEVAARCLSTSVEGVSIQCSALDHRPVARGGATLVLQHALAAPTLFHEPNGAARAAAAAN